MKKLVILIQALLLWCSYASAQCGEYIESISESELEPYILKFEVCDVGEEVFWLYGS